MALAILCALALLGTSIAGANEFLEKGYKSCGPYSAGNHTKVDLYAKRTNCKKALRVQRAYESGTDIYERRWSEYCLKGFPGWCCIGGGGAVTCRRHHSYSVSLDAKIDKRLLS